MIKKLLLSAIFISLTASLFSQGPGNDINFGSSAATNPSVRIKSSFPDLSSNFSITAWIKTTDNTKIGQRIFQDDESKTTGFGFSLGDPGNGKLRVYSRGNTPVTFDGSIVLSNNTWYHVAAVINTTSKTVSIYVNGVLDVTTSYTGSWGTDAGRASFGGETPSSGEAGSGYYVRGQLDEIIVWGVALTQTEIRDIMCKKQSASNANILGYWNLDGTITTSTNGVPETTSNAHAGTLATGMATTDVIKSGASLGDVSTYVYSPASWTGQSIAMSAAANGTTFTVNAISPASGGTAATGIHVYQVNAAPSTTTGITGLGTNNVYYGVYVVNPASVSLTGTIDFTNYIQTNNAQAFSRDNNASASWTAGSTNVAYVYTIGTNVSGKTQREFILGTTSNANGLPVDLLYFHAVPQGKHVKLSWSTATETNSKEFAVERSADGVNFSELLTQKSKASGGNSLIKLDYTDMDKNPISGTSYYRLRQTDYNGIFKYYTMVTLELVPDKNITFSIYPNPNSGEFTLDFSGIENNHEVGITLYNELGVEVYTSSFYSSSLMSNQVQIAPLNRLAKGNYFCVLEFEGIQKKIPIVVN